MLLWGEQHWSPAQTCSADRNRWTSEATHVQTLMEALPPKCCAPQKWLLEVKLQALLLDRAAGNIKTGCKIPNLPKRVAINLTNATLSPADKDPATASTLGKERWFEIGGKIHCKRFWEKVARFPISYLLTMVVRFCTWCCGAEDVSSDHQDWDHMALVLPPNYPPSIWRRYCCIPIPAAPCHLHSATVLQSTSAIWCHLTCAVAWSAAPSWAWLKTEEERGQSCLPRSHTLPTGPAANGTF